MDQGRSTAGALPPGPADDRAARSSPPTVSDAKPLGATTELVGRTLAATVATLRGAEAAWLTSYPAGWVVGLEGGLLAGENFDVFRFSAYSDIPGLALSGRLSFTVSNGTLVPRSEHGIVQVGGSGPSNGFLQVQQPQDLRDPRRSPSLGALLMPPTGFEPVLPP